MPEAKIKVKLVRDEIRPSTDVEFWNKSAEDNAYFAETYGNPGLLISEELVLSDDQLTRTRIQNWNLMPGLITTIAADQYIKGMIARNVAYNEGAGITRDQQTFEMTDANGVVISVGTFPSGQTA